MVKVEMLSVELWQKAIDKGRKFHLLVVVKGVVWSALQVFQIGTVSPEQTMPEVFFNPVSTTKSPDQFGTDYVQCLNRSSRPIGVLVVVRLTTPRALGKLRGRRPSPSHWQIPWMTVLNAQALSVQDPLSQGASPAVSCDQGQE
jgi:hypothetical protein